MDSGCIKILLFIHTCFFQLYACIRIFLIQDNEETIHVQPNVFKLDYFTASEPTDITLTPVEIMENKSVGTTIGLFSSVDRGENSHTYSLVAGDDDTDNAAFSIIGNSLQSAEVYDYETQANYSIRVRTTDQTGLFFEKSFSITISDVDEIPPDFDFF